MSKNLLLSIRFLQQESHARGDDGAPQWPPGPLRLFQAILTAHAGRMNERAGLQSSLDALRWFESLPPPAIVSPAATPASSKHRLYVPDNTGDLVAGSWSRSGTASVADYRTEKDIWPVRLADDPAAAVQFMYSADDDAARHLPVLLPTVRSITHLGWGVDMVVADAALI